MPDFRKRNRKLVGEMIRYYRNKAKLTQEKLAEKANLDAKYFGQVERGEETISLDAFLRIAKALKIPAARLLKSV